MTTTGPLSGLTIGVTAHRRAEDQIEALRRQGADVIHAATMQIVPVESDEQLIADTEAMLAAEPTALLVTTGQGFRSWLEALPEDLAARARDWVAATPVYCRGPKARGAVRGAGFPDPPNAPDETTESLVDLVLEAGVRDQVIGFQRHGYLDPVQIARLEEAGCTVKVVAPYRWVPGPDPQAVTALIDGIIDGRIHAVTFAAAPSVEALLVAADEQGRGEQLRGALRDGRCRAVSVGHVTAQPLQAEQIPTFWPERERMGAMVKLMVERLGDRVRQE